MPQGCGGDDRIQSRETQRQHAADPPGSQPSLLPGQRGQQQRDGRQERSEIVLKRDLVGCCRAGGCEQQPQKLRRSHDPSAACSERSGERLAHAQAGAALHRLLALDNHTGEDAPAQYPEPAAARQRHRRRHAQRAQAPRAYLTRRQLILQERSLRFLPAAALPD